MGLVVAISVLGCLALVVLSVLTGNALDAGQRREEADQAAGQWRRLAEERWKRDRERARRVLPGPEKPAPRCPQCGRPIPPLR